MKLIIHIFKKELKEIFRDKKAILYMVIIPLLAIPLIISALSFITYKFANNEASKYLKIAIVNDVSNGIFTNALKTDSHIKFSEYRDTTLVAELIRTDSLDAMFIFPENHQLLIDSNFQIPVVMHFDKTDEIATSRINKLVEKYKTSLENQRLESFNITAEQIKPVIIKERNAYSIEATLGKKIGGFLPYFFMLSCFSGAMYIAIELLTGEKERGTYELLLTFPINRIQLLTAKLTVIAFFSLLSGLLSIMSLLLLSVLSSFLPSDVSSIINIDKLVTFDKLFFITLLILPLSIFFAGILTALVSSAKTTKEAQAITNPFTMLLILPAILGILPLKFSFKIALIPLLNLSYASKEILAGTIDYGLYAVVFLSLITYAAISIWFANKSFGDEKNII